MEDPFSFTNPTPPTFDVDPGCSHRPDKRKSPKTSGRDSNAREGRKRTKRSKEFLNSLSKAKSQPFHLENNPSDVMSPALIFSVHSLTSKNTYEAKIGTTLSCTCHHFTWKDRSRVQVCKHLIWLHLFVLGVREDDDVIMQVSLTPKELVDIYDGHRLVPIRRIGSQPAPTARASPPTSPSTVAEEASTPHKSQSVQMAEMIKLARENHGEFRMNPDGSFSVKF